MLLSADRNEQSPLAPQHLRGQLLVFLAIVLGYFLLGYFGLSLATINRNASPIWPASGFGVGMLVLFGRRYAPAVFLGSLFVNFSVNTPTIGLIGAALGNMVESYIGARILLFGKRRNFFKHYSELFNIFIAATFSSLFSASIGVSCLNFIGVIPDESFFYAWYTWWSGNAIGILLVLPLFMEFFSNEERTKLTRKKIIYGFGLFIIILLSIYLVFVEGYNQALAWSLSPFFILSGMILGRTYSRIILIIFSIIVTALTATGYGPFEQGNTNANLIYVQTLLASFAFAILFVKPIHTGYKISSKYLFGIAFGWIIMFLVIYLTSSYEKNHTLEDFHKSTNEVVDSLTRLSGRYEALVKGAAALFRVSEEVTPVEWRTYVESVELQKYYDAAYGLGFVEYVSKKDLASFEKKNNIKTIIMDRAVADQYDHHLIIKYLEPLDKNLMAIGMDVGSEKTRRATINKALELREVRATGIYRLKQYKDEYGFVIIYPVFAPNHDLLGFISAPIVSTIFFGKYLDSFSHNLRIRISSGGKLIYHMDNYPTTAFRQNVYYNSKIISLFGKKFRIEFYPSENFFSLHSGSSAGLALLLNIFMLFIGAFLLEQLTFSQKAEALVEERTRELELSKIQLINSSKMASLGEMASGMAHEINNPLTIIQGKVKVISMMLEDLQLNQPSVFTEIHKIKLTTDRIDKIVKGLRNFSRASNNDPFEPILLEKLLEETLDLCSEKFKAYGIDLRIKPIPNVFIMCRPSQISQVFINLLNNSSDAIEENREKWIEIDFKVEDDKICIIFTDSGTGIPEDIAARIMEPFFTTKEVRKGTGLGLSIAKSIIETHHGSIWLDRSHPHTRFVIEFLTQS